MYYENPHWMDIEESFNKCQQWWACSCLTVQSTQMTLSWWHVPLSQDMKYHNDYIIHLSITMAPYHTQSSNLWHCITTAYTKFQQTVKLKIYNAACTQECRLNQGLNYLCCVNTSQPPLFPFYPWSLTDVTLHSFVFVVFFSLLVR